MHEKTTITLEKHLTSFLSLQDIAENVSKLTQTVSQFEHTLQNLPKDNLTSMLNAITVRRRFSKIKLLELLFT